MEATQTIGTWIGPGGETQRLQVTVRIEPAPHGGETVQTIDHQEVPRVDLNRIAFQGQTDYRTPRGRKWHWDGGRQNLGDLALVADFAPGWDAEKRDRLLTLWKEWHLDDMQPGCAHQTEIEGTVEERLAKIEPCPLTGYRYGRAWLVKLPTTEVIEEITEMFAGQL